MAIRKFKINTIEKFRSPVVGFKKKIYDGQGGPLIINPSGEDIYTRSPNIRTINIHEIHIGNNEVKLLRDLTDTIGVEIVPEWENEKNFDDKIGNFINEEEIPEDVLRLSISLICPRINHVLESKLVKLSTITAGESVFFNNVDLDDIVGNLRISSQLIRVKNANPQDSLIAHSKFSILSINEDITFYIDEVEIVGGNSLEIKAGDTGSKMFVIENIKELGVNPPVLVYNKVFKEFFHAGDDYDTVQVIMILIGLPYCEHILRWIIFGIPDFTNPQHQGLIKFIAQLCDMKIIDIQNISENNDSTIKEREYFKLCSVVLENIQGLGKGWKKSLYNIILREKNV